MKRRNEIFFGKTRNLERKKKKCVLVYQVGLLKIFVSFSPFETSLEQSIEGGGGGEKHHYDLYPKPTNGSLIKVKSLNLITAADDIRAIDDVGKRKNDGGAEIGGCRPQ